MRETPDRRAQVHEKKKAEIDKNKVKNLRESLKKLKLGNYNWLKLAAVPLAAISMGQQVNRVLAQDSSPPARTDSEWLLPSVIEELEAAQQYLADNEQDAILIARLLDFLSSDYEHPSNMCGPLSAQILYDSGYFTDEMFPNGFNIRDFWLADPERLSSIFSASPANELMLGDFLYSIGNIPNGGYDHMFTVTRIERFGNYYRAFSTMNQPTRDGFVIQEFLLFDSSDPTQGLFQTWQNSWTHGKTGQLGFHWWRPTNIGD